MKSAATEAPVLVIGYGNTLRRDDGAGCAAARRLARRLPKKIATVIAVHQLLPELAEPLSRAKFAVFIDADAKLPPGSLRRRSLRIPTNSPAKSIAHHQSAHGILRLARDLYGRRPRALLFSVGGQDFSFGSRLSPAVRLALRPLSQDVVQSVLSFSRYSK